MALVLCALCSVLWILYDCGPGQKLFPSIFRDQDIHVLVGDSFALSGTTGPGGVSFVWPEVLEHPSESLEYCNMV